MKFRAAILTMGIAAAAVWASSCASVIPPSSGTHFGGSLNVDGPLMVNGPLWVGGSATVHGAVRTRKLNVGGSVESTLPHSEVPGPAGQMVSGPLTVGGSLDVNGPLTVDGSLYVGGSLTTEISQPPEIIDESVTE